MKNSKLYVDLWTNLLPQFSAYIARDSGSFVLQLKDELFKTCGNRKKYSFRLECVNGIAINNIDGNAVARDLLAVLVSDSNLRGKMSKKNIVFRLDNAFAFHVIFTK
ncbi:hypothetical protein [Sphingobacterium sp.]|uniref:hypothetical protein n=1 Tax=Sphingobacterium sp. TaxID=341027 RepID=UPI00289B324E|nr:hypothetical protein [Sphingobacterium sp.]